MPTRAFLSRQLLPAALLMGAIVGVLAGITALNARNGRREQSFHLVQKSSPVFTDVPRPFSHTFRIANPTRKRVRITSRRCLCDCTKPKLGADVLDPGQETTLELQTTIGPPAALLSLTCTVSTDFAEHPVWTYTLEVPVYPAFQLTPSRLAFGIVEPSQALTRQLLFEAFAEPGRAFSEFKPVETGPVTLRANGPTTEVALSTGVRRRAIPLMLELQTGEAFGEQSEFLRFAPNDDGQQPNYMQVTWFVRSPIEVSPRGGAFFGRVRTHEDGRTAKVLLSSADQAFRITAVQPYSNAALHDSSVLGPTVRLRSNVLREESEGLLRKGM
jgi:hypothetical protein